MADHRKTAWNKKAAPYVTTAMALEIVSLFGFAYLTDSHVPGISPLAATSIFIDGTKDILPTGDSQAADRMRNALNGAYDQCGAGSTGPCAHNVYVDYPRDFGILTGGVGYDVSRGIATDNTIAAIRAAQADPTYTKGDGIYVVGYSQGANASSDVIKRAEQLNSDTDPTNDLDLSDVTFVLAGNGARNDGGLWARLPAGVYVPFLGLDFGASTNPTTGPNAPGQVIMITKQYDGAADWPKYVFVNPLAAANAALGFMYVHNGYYADTDISDLDTDNNGKLSQAEIDAANAGDKYIVTQNGDVVDVLIKNQPGDLPITQPLKDLGVPEELIKAIDPLLRAMIDAGYDRPTDGVYPAQPVHFGLIPKPSKMFEDFLAIESGADQTEQNLDALNPLQVAAPNVGSALAKQGTVAPTVAPSAPPKGPDKPQLPTLLSHQWVPQVITPKAPAAEEEIVEPTAEEYVPPAPPAEEDPILLGNVISPNGGQQGVVRGPIGGAPAAPGLKKIVTAINGVVSGTATAIQNALTPKPASSSPASSSAPEPPSPPPADNGTGTGEGGTTR